MISSAAISAYTFVTHHARRVRWINPRRLIIIIHTHNRSLRSTCGGRSLFTIVLVFLGCNNVFVRCCWRCLYIAEPSTWCPGSTPSSSSSIEWRKWEIHTNRKCNLCLSAQQIYACAMSTIVYNLKKEEATIRLDLRSVAVIKQVCIYREKRAAIVVGMRVAWIPTIKCGWRTNCVYVLTTAVNYIKGICTICVNWAPRYARNVWCMDRNVDI